MHSTFAQSYLSCATIHAFNNVRLLNRQSGHHSHIPIARIQSTVNIGKKTSPLQPPARVVLRTFLKRGSECMTPTILAKGGGSMSLARKHNKAFNKGVSVLKVTTFGRFKRKPRGNPKSILVGPQNTPTQKNNLITLASHPPDAPTRVSRGVGQIEHLGATEKNRQREGGAGRPGSASNWCPKGT